MFLIPNCINPFPSNPVKEENTSCETTKFLKAIIQKVCDFIEKYPKEVCATLIITSALTATAYEAIQYQSQIASLQYQVDWIQSGNNSLEKGLSANYIKPFAGLVLFSGVGIVIMTYAICEKLLKT